MLTKKTSLGNFDGLNEACALILIDQPKDSSIQQKSEEHIKFFFSTRKADIRFRDVSDLCFKSVKIKVDYGERLYGWKRVFTTTNPMLGINLILQYQKKILILGNRFFSSEVNSHTFIENIKSKFSSCYQI